jgi:hypothetical protein
LSSNLTNAADQLFKEFALRHCFLTRMTRKSEVEQLGVDLLMALPVQAGLTFELQFAFADDILFVVAGEHTGEWYIANGNIEEVWRTVVQIADGLVAGTYRVVEFWQRGRARKTAIEIEDTGSWKAVSTRYSTILLPLIRTEKVILQNKM